MDRAGADQPLEHPQGPGAKIRGGAATTAPTESSGAGGVARAAGVGASTGAAVAGPGGHGVLAAATIPVPPARP